MSLANNDQNVKHNEVTDLKNKVVEIVDKLGVPKNLKGYGYLVDAICLCAENHEYILCPLKDLYQAIAEQHDDRIANIKTSLERALERAWYLGNTDMFKEIFGYSLHDKVKCPSVKKFLFLISKLLLSSDDDSEIDAGLRILEKY